MAKTIKQSKTDDVNDYLDKLVHPLKGVLLELRQHLLTRFSEISEHIKWNSLSFYFNGDMNAFNPKEYKRDLLVVNLNKKEYVLLVFPTGYTILHKSQLLEGDYADGRRMVKIYSTADLTSNKDELFNIIESWISQIDK
ncbi:MAG: DUF1801 domain-containing protein [Saprospiraceae bacterium]|nr:DUF1801 domain-containing protein [Saprospiraceae bacterium]MBK7736272.1 DUF1801 domain-containing protein [Saprospiraceae bacterium]MBK7912362.1 DUF1801 domain-containing protein [Saprospiraceae bacterium]